VRLWSGRLLEFPADLVGAIEKAHNYRSIYASMIPHELQVNQMHYEIKSRMCFSDFENVIHRKQQLFFMPVV
jgi:hypothetical protein